MTVNNYLDYTGLQRFKTNLDTQYAGIYRTETQVNNQIDAKLSTYSQNYVQISSDVPTIAGGAVEGIIYLVPDANAPQGSFKYVAYAVESVSGTPTVVKLGTGTTEIPIVDQALEDGSTHAISNDAVYDALGLKVDKSSIAATVADDDTNAVSGDAVYEFVTSQMSNIQTITNPEIDVLFITAGQIWIDGTGWTTMKAKFDSTGEFVALTKNSSGYYVITPADVTGTVDTLVLATSDDSISTGALTDVTSASDLNGLIGKIVGAADEATSLTILA